jgi:PKD repeat protein
MRRLFTLTCILIIAGGLAAQTSGGPDAYGYTWKNSFHTVSPPVYSWFDITAIGAEVGGLGDDNIIGPFTASNGFQFYWYPTPQFYIGSNGYISFSGYQMASLFPASVPLAAPGNDWIAPFMADLNFGGTGNPAKVYYWYNADSLCVSFVNVPNWVNSTSGYTGSNTFQVILNKVDKSITFNYQSMSIGTVTALDAVVGIENVTGTLGLGAMIDLLPTSFSTIKFYYPSTTTYAVTDGGINWNGNNKNAGIFVKKGVSYPLITNVKNYGNQPLGGFTVRDTVVTNMNMPVTQGSVSVPGLSMGQDCTLTMPNTFTPPAAGTYKLNTSIFGISGDMVASNDRLEQEIVSIDTSSNFMVLDYSDGLPDGTGLGWQGGNGGVGVYLEPPVYPVRIVSSRYYITANSTTAPVGFFAMIYDDNGPNGGAGALLDSVYVPPANIMTGTYTTVSPANNNLIITSGGVYLRWHMGGADINIGRDITPPISRRTFEILDNSWSDYRDKVAEDFLISMVTEFAGPKAAFSFNNSQDPSISFTDNSIQNPTAWSWDFGDNSPLSTVQNPTHTYASTGTYNVCLTVSNSLGSNTLCQAVIVANGPPVAAFTYILAGMPTVAFIDQTAGNPTGWSWDFDDSGNDSSNVQNPVYTFKTNGPHSVCLKATNLYGQSQQLCQTLNVTGVGIDENSDPLNSVLLPNPVSNQAVMTLPAYKPGSRIQVNCYTATGALTTLSYEQNAELLIIRRGELASGIYLIEVYGDGVCIAKAKMICE